MLHTHKKLTSFFLLIALSACDRIEQHPEPVNLQLAKEIHAKALVLDAHADIEIPGKESTYVGKDGLSKVEPDKMRAGHLDAVVMA
ncbi:MAG: hypothetical protein P8I81_03215, partial [Pseudomonadales bacterium]|nr:hypothetical protein [Pseudomonadales bacterium]